MISRCWEAIHFFLVFQIRKLEPSYIKMAEFASFFFGWGGFFLPSCKRTRSKRKTTTFQFQTTKISPSWAGPWKLKSPFNNILDNIHGLCQQNSIVFFFPLEMAFLFEPLWWTDSCVEDLLQENTIVQLFRYLLHPDCGFQLVIWWFCALVDEFLDMSGRNQNPPGPFLKDISSATYQLVPDFYSLKPGVFFCG